MSPIKMKISIQSYIMSLLAIAPYGSGAWSFQDLYSIGSSGQVPVTVSNSIGSSNYSVGFSLSSAYGAASVIIDYPNGGSETRTWAISGSKEFRETMAKLSLESSRHLAPPYDDEQEYFDDIPRVLHRRARKKIGLPASADVGALASVVKELRSQIESDINIKVENATLAGPHLVALYQDDIQDICDYVGFRYIIPKAMYRPFLWETGAAYAGYGMGLCEHWQNDTQCAIENGELPKIPIMAVHYSQTALTVTHASIRRATHSFEPDSRRMENFTLGSNALSRYPSPDDYWRDVKRGLLLRMIESPAMQRPVKILVTGDGVDGKFASILKEATLEHLGEPVPIINEDAMLVAAKGAAELRRRGEADWA